MSFDDVEGADDEISFMALQAGTPVVTSDGQTAGHITHVLGDLEEDVFDGIGYRHGLFGQRMLPRRAVARITRGAVHLSITLAEVEKMSTAYAEERMYEAKEQGKKLRWSRDEDDERY
jgi:hypothetical protein